MNKYFTCTAVHIHASLDTVLMNELGFFFEITYLGIWISIPIWRKFSDSKTGPVTEKETNVNSYSMLDEIQGKLNKKFIKMKTSVTGEPNNEKMMCLTLVSSL